MNREETLTIMGVLKAAYPNYYRDMSRRDAEGIVDLWQAMFADEPLELVAAAVKTHIAGDRKGYPPHIGVIKDAIVRLTKPPELSMSEMEAWALVRKAIHGASMEGWSRVWRNGVQDQRTSAERHFEALPPLVRRVVGNPNQLAEWERVDSQQIDTVIQSNFLRSWRARAEGERELLAMPADIRDKIGLMAGNGLGRISGAVTRGGLSDGAER